MAGPPDLIYMEAACVCAGIAAATDLRSRRIPNWLTGSGVVAGLGLHLALGGARDAGYALLAGLISGSIFFLFFVAGGMGAGDVKLMAALGCLAGHHAALHLLVATALLGALAAVLLALRSGRLRQTLAQVGELVAHHQANGLQNHPDLNVSNPSTLRMPYAVPILGGCIVTLILTLHGGAAL